MTSTTAVSKQTYDQGAVIGSIVGFGVGHAIQDRYTADKGNGWIFSLGESIPFAIVITGSIAEWIGDPCGGDAGTHSDCHGSSRPHIFSTDDAWATATAIALGFKVWEIVDLWKSPRDVASAKKTNPPAHFQVALVPLNQSNLGLGFNLPF